MLRALPGVTRLEKTKAINNGCQSVLLPETCLLSYRESNQWTDPEFTVNTTVMRVGVNNTTYPATKLDLYDLMFHLNF